MNRPRVLVIEDEPRFAALVTRVLTEAGYAVRATDSAIRAMALARQWAPCVILLDLGLPYRSGASLLAELKADPATAPIPVVVVSGMAEALTDERRALAAAVVPKPFGARELLEALRVARPRGQTLQDPAC